MAAGITICVSSSSQADSGARLTWAGTRARSILHNGLGLEQGRDVEPSGSTSAPSMSATATMRAPAPIEVTGRRPAHVAETLQRYGRALDLNAEEGAGLQGALSDAVARHQLGYRLSLAAEPERLLDAAQGGVALAPETSLQRMCQADQLAGGDDLVLVRPEVGAGRVALGKVGADGGHETLQHRLGIRCARVPIDACLGASVGNLEHRHLVRHGPGQVDDFLQAKPPAHSNAAGAHIRDQAVDHEPPSGSGRLIVPLGDQVRRPGLAVKRPARPVGPLWLGCRRTTAPDSSGTPSTSTSERTGPICRGGKFVTATTSLPRKCAGSIVDCQLSARPASPERTEIDQQR